MYNNLSSFVLSVRVANHPDEVELCKEWAEHDLKSALNAIKTKPLGK